ncbi:hypothetical protein DSO57_1026600 [Entomophthora muscae]|uniref:Uncharacterized protein n=1 Tax=Entomophthora muscae TaxID=34485 RepID=A0ACC2TPC5_9FUNG|nr:hypothetical protein DSO57_1026600 [Entomophthora muscae]
MRMMIPDTIVAPLHLLFESNVTMAINAMSCTMFLGNVYHSLWLMSRNRKPIYQLCLAQSLVGVVVNVMILISFFSFDKLCTSRILIAAIGNLVSMTCIELILLIKARMCSNTLPQFVIQAGYVLIGIKIVCFGVNLWFTSATVTPLYNCGARIIPVAGGVAVMMELIVNVYLSGIFLSIIYRQWRFMRLFLYEALLKDGLLFSLATTTTSILVTVFAFANVLGSNSAVLFNISWVVASSFTVHQLRNSHKIKTRSSNTNSNSNGRTLCNTYDKQKSLPSSSSQTSDVRDSLIVTVQYESTDTYELSPTKLRQEKPHI